MGYHPLSDMLSYRPLFEVTTSFNFGSTCAVGEKALCTFEYRSCKARPRLICRANNEISPAGTRVKSNMVIRCKVSLPTLRLPSVNHYDCTLIGADSLCGDSSGRALMVRRTSGFQQRSSESGFAVLAADMEISCCS
ncbi:hypothetical protein DACRYDRAFT_25567 [Dacryopinax primogenitus]|uniref:Uncharacterized protein n=1 Tax=Dacryopinax primogenitus (strain DJM 731) TaxID=1858805 RepID=M5FTQ6_DACPD|nr:uncharacterized protein DACRYDRAFT_25567 [Dacryopinax primogenitus]EJT96616.1 hypothetical protein DACRYDRAFT_25567 [Dacryopinax primogenitus]